MSIFLVLCPVGWGYLVGFFGGSSSDDQLVPSVEMLGRMTLTFGWWYRIGFFKDRTRMISWKVHLFRFDIQASFEPGKK